MSCSPCCAFHAANVAVPWDAGKSQTPSSVAPAPAASISAPAATSAKLILLMSTPLVACEKRGSVTGISSHGCPRLSRQEASAESREGGLPLSSGCVQAPEVLLSLQVVQQGAQVVDAEELPVRVSGPRGVVAPCALDVDGIGLGERAVAAD